MPLSPCVRQIVSIVLVNSEVPINQQGSQIADYSDYGVLPIDHFEFRRLLELTNRSLAIFGSDRNRPTDYRRLQQKWPDGTATHLIWVPASRKTPTQAPLPPVPPLAQRDNKSQ